MTDRRILLGLECGGTRTVALAADLSLQQIAYAQAGPCNLRLVTDAQLEARFRELAAQVPAPDALGVGMAGVRDAVDCARIERVLHRIWPGVPHRVDHDLESALAAAALDGGNASETRVVILSGTGSCCYGRNPNGRTAKVGGWGHQLGDRGSAYDIAFRALRAVAHEFDHRQVWGRLGQRILRTLLLQEPNDLIAWLQQAAKTEVAALAPEVFAAAGEGDKVARAVITETSELLASDALACAGRLTDKRSPLRFVLAGSVLLKQAGLVRNLTRRLRTRYPRATVAPLSHPSVWGAVVMARSALEAAASPVLPKRRTSVTPVSGGPALIPTSQEISPTEQRHPGSMHLDRMPLSEAIDLFLSEDSRIPSVIRSHRADLERLIHRTVRALKSGGRLFYVGAGTSGRLGVLDASECPPTFRTPPEWVQGIMAGGEKALHSSVENAEDDPQSGKQAVVFRQVGKKDVVLGIAASGRTPFVWGALAEARKRGAFTALLCFHPHLQFARGQKPDVLLALDVGPELLTGSTRLKSGTATKLVLNILTTLTMVRLGKVMENLMVDVNPSNLKLRDRACRIVMELTRLDRGQAQAALEQTGWRVAEAVRRHRKPARV